MRLACSALVISCTAGLGAAAQDASASKRIEATVFIIDVSGCADEVRLMMTTSRERASLGRTRRDLGADAIGSALESRCFQALGGPRAVARNGWHTAA
jgi:hypothetical protein